MYHKEASIRNGACLERVNNELAAAMLLTQETSQLAAPIHRLLHADCEVISVPITLSISRSLIIGH